MRGNRRRNDRFSPDQPTGRAAMLGGPVERSQSALLTIFLHPKSVCRHLRWHAVYIGPECETGLLAVVQAANHGADIFVPYTRFFSYRALSIV
jgi:hypothetical protein